MVMLREDSYIKTTLLMDGISKKIELTLTRQRANGLHNAYWKKSIAGERDGVVNPSKQVFSQNLNRD